MNERKNNSWSGSGYVNSEVKTRNAGDHTIASSRLTALSRKSEKKFYIDIEAWNEQAEELVNAGQGARINILDGYFTTEEWEDKTTGEKRFKNVLTVTELEILSEGDGGSSAPKGKSAAKAPAKGGSKPPFQKNSYGNKGSSGKPSGSRPSAVDDDIPF